MHMHDMLHPPPLRLFMSSMHMYTLKGKGNLACMVSQDSTMDPSLPIKLATNVR